MSDTKIQPLLFGGDINVYSVARAFHEAYGVKSICYGLLPGPFPCVTSNILDYRCCPDNESAEAFLRNVKAVAAECPDKTVLVVGCGDSYVKLAAHLKDQFPANAKCNTPRPELLDEVVNKEKFYALCDRYNIAHPATFIYDKSMGHDFKLPWGPPYIAKPADSVAYWACGDRSLNKVYVCKDWDSLLTALDAVYKAGYRDHMVLQEFIPGDDSQMRVLTNYSNTEGKVKLMCLGHVLLEEHSPHGIGNHAVIITEQDKPLSDKLRDMLEDLHYTGFSNFDIKLDPRDNVYKVFEINCRQGRSNYYVTGAGYNIAEYLVRDLVLGEDLGYTVAANRSLWRMVPRFVAYRYISKRYHGEMKSLIRAGADHHAVVYRKDLPLKRRIQILRNHIGNSRRFAQYNKRPED